MTVQQIKEQIKDINEGLAEFSPSEKEQFGAKLLAKKKELETELSKLESATKQVPKTKPTTPKATAQKVAKQKVVSKAKAKTSKVASEAKSLLEKLRATKAQKSFNAGKTKEELERDLKRQALPIGKRVSKAGHKNQYGTSEGGNVYYEGRSNRADVSTKRKPYLEKGGEISQLVGEVYRPFTSHNEEYWVTVMYADFENIEYADDKGEIHKAKTKDFLDSYIKVSNQYETGGEIENEEQSFHKGDKIKKKSTGEKATIVKLNTSGNQLMESYIVEIEDGKHLYWWATDMEVCYECGGRMMERGGYIKNQYAGKTAEQVWNEWTIAQRSHFLLDHVGRAKVEPNKDKIFDELSEQIKLDLEFHITEGQYEKGGSIKQYKDLSLEKPLTVNDYRFDNGGVISKVKEVDLVKLGFVTISNRVTQIRNSQDSINVFRDFWNENSINIQESFNVLLLNKANKPIGIYNLSKGGIDGTVADPELIAAMAVKTLAKGVIICHNHPSGNLQPSTADITISKKIKEGLKLFDISLLDSMIITENSYLSFADDGYLEKGGVTYNTGRSWHQDRARHNKGEDWEKPLSERKMEGGGVVKKGEKYIINLDGKNENEEVTVISDFKAGHSKTEFITLQRKVGANYFISLSRFEKSIVKKLESGGEVYAKGGEIVDIEKQKKALIAKAKKSGIYEDFGQTEVRKLEDKYGYTQNVKMFDDWCMNFDKSQYEQGGKVTFADKVKAIEDKGKMAKGGNVSQIKRLKKTIADYEKLTETANSTLAKKHSRNIVNRLTKELNELEIKK